MTCVPSVQLPSRRPPLPPFYSEDCLAGEVALRVLFSLSLSLFSGLPALLPLLCPSCVALFSLSSLCFPASLGCVVLSLPPPGVACFCCPLSSCLLLLLPSLLSLSGLSASLPCLAAAAASWLTALPAPSQFLWVGAFPLARRPKVLPCPLATRLTVLQKPSWASVVGRRGACWRALVISGPSLPLQALPPLS